MKKFINNLGKGMTIGLGFIIVAGIGYIGLKARSPDATGLRATTGDVLSSDKWNKLVPETMVGAFLASSCPEGRKPADGTNGTTDLRGQFLRGLNSFDGGNTTRSDGKQDPDGASRTIGSYQGDAYGPIRYAGIISYQAGSQNLYFPFVYHDSFTKLFNETRGKNVAIIFCVKK